MTEKPLLERLKEDLKTILELTLVDLELKLVDGEREEIIDQAIANFKRRLRKEAVERTRFKGSWFMGQWPDDETELFVPLERLVGEEE